MVCGLEGDTEGIVPAGYLLHQTCPNAFNPTTVIRHELPAGGDVKLVVYDLLGRGVGYR
jgi:hypothetical protein